jgi:hypothetical protein
MTKVMFGGGPIAFNQAGIVAGEANRRLSFRDPAALIQSSFRNGWRETRGCDK